MVLPFLFSSFLGPRLEHEIHHIKNDTTGKGFLSRYYLFRANAGCRISVSEKGWMGYDRNELT